MKTLTKENYKEYTDKYFLRTKKILEEECVNPIVRYQVFARENIKAITGIDEAVEFIKDVAGEKVRIYSLKEGQECFAKAPIMKLEGRVQDFVDLETGYLGILSGALTGDLDFNDVRKKAREIFKEAKGKPVLYFGARHFAPAYDEKIAKICQEEGFVGASTDVGAKAWNAKGQGTTPHALILTYAAFLDEFGSKANPTVYAAKAFDRNIPEDVPRIILIDTFNREIEDTIATAKEIPNLTGVRIDTCGENYTQGSREIVLPKLDVDEKYLRGKGVSVAGVWAMRKAFDKNNLENLSIVVSSGFNTDKTKAFVEADVLTPDICHPLF